MESAQFNAFDALVALVLLASGIFAFRRGLVREIMALGTWVLASIFAFSFYPIARPLLEENIKNTMLADAVTAIGLFCVAIIVLVPLGDYLSGLVKNPTLSSIDRSLGFVFGLIRGFLVMCLLYLGMTFIWSAERDAQPKWLAGAKTTPALAYGVEAIKGLVPDDSEETASEKLQKSREAAQEAVENARHLEDISTAVPVYRGEGEPESYDTELRNEMDDLLDRNAQE